MKAKSFLEKAIAVLAERGSQYESGGEENSMREIVELHTFITPGATLDYNACAMDELEGWYFMLALKLVRLRKSIEQGKASRDSIVDLLGYTAKMGECLFPEEPEPSIMAAPPHRDKCPHTSCTLKDIGGDTMAIVCDDCGKWFNSASEYIGHGGG